MSAAAIKSYRFATPQQWGAGVLARAEFDAQGQLQPFAPYARACRLLPPAAGAYAPAFGYDGTAWWRGADARLYRLPAAGGDPVAVAAPADIAHARRLVIGRRVVWVAGIRAGSLHCHAQDDLGVILSVELAAAQIVDIADDGRNGLWVLAERGGSTWLMHVDCAGGIACEFDLGCKVHSLRALVYLRTTRRIVLLAHDGATLWFLDTRGENVQAPLLVVTLWPCFKATQLGSDGRARILIAGADALNDGAQSRVIVTDAFGDKLDRIDIALPATGVAAHAGMLLVTGSAGAQYCGGATAETAAAADCVLLTPFLHSPERGNEHGWLRAEIAAHLPRGALLSVEYAATDNPALREEVALLTQDRTLPPQVRLSRVARLLGDWSAPLRYAGSDAADEAQLFAAPLFDVRAPYLWLRITLTAPPGSAMPRLTELRVLYPQQSLMQHLPAIYRRDDQPQDFMRALVGVLETTTQGIDCRIAALGSLLHPQTAEVEWLDYIARWLGLPWDDALDAVRKRALMLQGHRILALRGTRAGLEVLLACLFPGEPRWFRIIDFTAEHMPARVGGAGCSGAPLPALLAGLPAAATALGRKAILGRARLPCPGATADVLAALAGRIRIDIIASAAERQAWEPWLPALIDAVVPVTARVTLRWRSRRPDWFGTTLNEARVIGAPAGASLGENAILGHSRLAADRPMTLSESGVDFGFKLQ